MFRIRCCDRFGGPHFRLQVDDKIFKIGGTEVTGMDHETIVQMILSVLSVEVVCKRYL